MKSDMNQTIALLKDNQFFAGLLNGPCKPVRDGHDNRTVEAAEERPFIPINPDWIDEEMSERLTKVYHSMVPDETPFVSIVRVVRNPDTIMNGIAVDDGRKRTRYIVVTVVQEAEYPYDMNFPLIQIMGIVSLSAWETTRSSIAASEAFAKVMITEQPVPPILNNATVEWVSLYVGRENFTGPTNLRTMTAISDRPPDDLDIDTHLYILRSMKDPLAQRLVEASDQDCLQQNRRENI